jgi:branched-subunit amino acid aminotransferase/4-amino-4-deoxychorismate lyase
MEYLACVDGEVMAAAEATIPATDEGLLRGDGVFEVMRLYAGRPFAYDDHLARMRRSAQNLRLPLDVEAMRADAEALLARSGELDALLPRPARRSADGARHLRAHAHPRRDQVPVLRRQHARRPPGPGARVR